MVTKTQLEKQKKQVQRDFINISSSYKLLLIIFVVFLLGHTEKLVEYSIIAHSEFQVILKSVSIWMVIPFVIGLLCDHRLDSDDLVQDISEIPSILRSSKLNKIYIIVLLCMFIVFWVISLHHELAKFDCTNKEEPNNIIYCLEDLDKNRFNLLKIFYE